MITDPSSLLNCAIDINQNSSYCDPVINQKTKSKYINNFNKNTPSLVANILISSLPFED